MLAEREIEDAFGQRAVVEPQQHGVSRRRSPRGAQAAARRNSGCASAADRRRRGGIDLRGAGADAAARAARGGGDRAGIAVERHRRQHRVHERAETLAARTRPLASASTSTTSTSAALASATGRVATAVTVCTARLGRAPASSAARRAACQVRGRARCAPPRRRPRPLPGSACWRRPTRSSPPSCNAPGPTTPPRACRRARDAGPGDAGSAARRCAPAALERRCRRRTPDSRGASPGSGDAAPRIDRGVERRPASLVALRVADDRHDQQVARARRRDVGEPHRLGAVAAQLLLRCFEQSCGAHPHSGSAHSPRVGVDVARGRARASRRHGGIGQSTTTGNSSPLARCTVMMRTPSVPSSTTGASSASPRSASSSSRSTKARNDGAPRALEAPREVDHAQAVRERLLAGRPDRDAGVGAHGVEQLRRACRRSGGGCGRGAARASTSSASATCAARVLVERRARSWLVRAAGARRLVRAARSASSASSVSANNGPRSVA